MKTEEIRFFIFDVFVFDARDRRLYRQEQKPSILQSQLASVLSLFLIGKTEPHGICVRTHEQVAAAAKSIRPDVADESRYCHTLISRLRYLLDPEDRERFIATRTREGYEWMVPVKTSPTNPFLHFDSTTIEGIIPATESPIVFVSAMPKKAPVRLVSIKFAPIYVGARWKQVFESGNNHDSFWGEYAVVKTPYGRLVVSPPGIGVWHIVEECSFECLADFASWRRRSYKEILEGRHPVSTFSQHFGRTHAGSNDPDGLLGRIGYVFSVYILRTGNDVHSQQLRTVLKLLSCPRALEATTRERAASLESKFLTEGFETPDVTQFGVAGVDNGYASWSAVSYAPEPHTEWGLVNKIVEVELGVQRLWWLCSCLRKGVGSTFVVPSVKGVAQSVKNEFSRLTNINPTEPLNERTMIEAIISTSRLQDQVREVLTLYQKERN